MRRKRKHTAPPPALTANDLWAWRLRLERENPGAAEQLRAINDRLVAFARNCYPTAEEAAANLMRTVGASGKIIGGGESE